MLRTSSTREKIEVVEVGLRDGLQILDRVMPTADKIAWLSAEHSCGVRCFECASFVPPKLMPQMADAANVVSAARKIDGLTVAALVPNVRGAEAAIAAGAQVITIPISASEAHSQANLRRSSAEAVATLRDIRRVIDRSGAPIRLDAGIATAFGCTIQGDVPETAVIALAQACADAGADTIGLADTVGYANPEQVRRLIVRTRERVGDRLRSAHFHDTRGTGLANVVAAVEAGIRVFDASLGGLGGCPHAPGASGNIATEDLVFMLEAMGFDTGIDLSALIAVRHRLAGWLPGERLHGKLAQAGLPKTWHSSVGTAA
ncbi:MAG: hydroxymethylglutaryl-CoA lyase [Pseudomonadota bacterium]